MSRSAIWLLAFAAMLTLGLAAGPALARTPPPTELGGSAFG